jgi:hypothetical protein
MHELGVKHVLLENPAIYYYFPSWKHPLMGESHLKSLSTGVFPKLGGWDYKSCLRYDVRHCIALNGRRVNDPRQNMSRKIMLFMLQMVKLTIAFGDYSILQI